MQGGFDKILVNGTAFYVLGAFLTNAGTPEQTRKEQLPASYLVVCFCRCVRRLLLVVFGVRLCGMDQIEQNKINTKRSYRTSTLILNQTTDARQ